MTANRKQIIRNIVNIIKGNSKKINQLETVQDITFTCTSDDHINIICELYHGNIVRYVINGTRSGMVITADALTGEIVRKPYKENPWSVTETECYVSEILKEVR